MAPRTVLPAVLRMEQIATMASFNDDRFRCFRQLYELKCHTFVFSCYRTVGRGVPTACYGCSRVFSTRNASALGAGYVTTAPLSQRRIGDLMGTGDTSVYWVCSKCFNEFRGQLSFTLDSEHHLDEVLSGLQAGPSVA